MSEMQVVVACKKKDNKAFMSTQKVWFNVKDFVIPYLEKINKGDTVSIEVEKKGVAQYVSKLMKVEPISQLEATKTEEPKFKCPVCGKAMKDDKYPVCYMCNKAGKKAPETAVESTDQVKEKAEKPVYMDKTAQIQRGNALNAASMVASGQTFVDSETGMPDPDGAAQYVKTVAEQLLEWLRAE